MESLEIARSQFGITTFHHFFEPLTISVSNMVAALQTHEADLAHARQG
jgi:cytochrome bd-type quinol oxidase subunit 1